MIRAATTTIILAVPQPTASVSGLGRSCSISTHTEGGGEMRGTKAKALRRAIYGDFSLRHRTYSREGAGRGVIMADLRRRAYQAAKRGRP